MIYLNGYQGNISVLSLAVRKSVGAVQHPC